MVLAAQKRGTSLGTERFFRPGYAANLVANWIPALDGVDAKLKRGARAADVGCGHGASTILMAQAYPRSRFTGFDDHAPSVEWARKSAAAAGVADRVGFEVAGAKEFTGDGYDLVAMFDCLHDMGDPVGAAERVKRSLARDGTWVIVEPLAAEARVRDVVTRGGFTRFRRATQTPFDLVFEARP